MKELRFALLGTGFWSRYQLAGWGELPGVRCIALYNRTRAKAEALARECGGLPVYDDAEELLRRERPDFIDIVTDVGTHSRFVQLAAAHGVPVICQKPLATSLGEAEQMLAACRTAGVPLFVHENWRWQTPLREFSRRLREGAVGRPFRARIDMVSGFPVFKNQPFLAELEQFILADLGSHIFDAARFLFGDPDRIYCRTTRVTPGIRGEDVATATLGYGGDGLTVTCNLAYAGTPLERECFPETLCFVEGERGSLELTPGHEIRHTTARGTVATRHPPPVYPWADPAYAIVHSSIVDCNRDLLQSLRTGAPAETSGDDNLKTVRLVFAAYQSAATGQVVSVS